MIRVIELFAGIGSQHSALDWLGIPFNITGIAEIDKYAIKSYEAIHGKVNNYGDISKIERLDKADFWTYSFPCQDISIAGRQSGINEGTRSGLLYEVERLLEIAKRFNELPTYLMLENVRNLVGKKFKNDFDRWINKLTYFGYNTYWKILNAKNYGVPQNRERVFAISILREYDMGYQFPQPFDSALRLKDILEKEVDEKFFLSAEITSSFRVRKRSNVVGDLLMDKWQDNMKRIYDVNEVAPTINTMGGGYREPKILTDDNRIRKLTPKECFRLMGFTDEQFCRAEAVNSNSQLYKQAGNSIVVDVLYHLFKNLFLVTDTQKLERQITIFD